MEAIRILIVDDVKNTRESIRRILSFNPDFEVIGEACCGSEAISLTELLKPDIALMDINMPDIDGIKTTELLSYRSPGTSVIMMSFQNESEYMTKSMLAGAKAYVIKPFTGNEITNIILNVYHKEARKRESIPAPGLPEKECSARIISVIGCKGGTGKTSTAVNLAVELASSKTCKVLLLDLNLQFGDVASFLNLVPKRTITDLVQAGSLKFEEIRFHIITHPSGVEILAAATRPEYAEMVNAEHIGQILQEAKNNYDYIICDNSSYLDDLSLAEFDAADEILVIVGLDIPAIKNAKLTLETLANLDYASKIKIVVNKFDRKIGITLKEIENSLNHKIAYCLPLEEQMVAALNKGVPFCEAYPRTGTAQVLKKMAADLTGITTENKTDLPNVNIQKNIPKVANLQKILGFGR